MMTSVALGLMLAFEPKEPGIMNRPPRDPRASILTAKLLKRVGFVSILLCGGAFGLYEWMVQFKGATQAEAQTVAANVIVIGEIFYLFNCRSLRRSMFRIGVFANKAAIAGAMAMLLLQIFFANAAPMNHLFHTAPVELDAWLATFAFGIALYVAVEIEKYLVGYTLQGAEFRT